MENANLNENDISELKKTEGKIVKRAVGVPNLAYTTAILNAMGTMSIRNYINKRRVNGY